jgi:hypothetical protein
LISSYEYLLPERALESRSLTGSCQMGSSFHSCVSFISVNQAGIQVRVLHHAGFCTGWKNTRGARSNHRQLRGQADSADSGGGKESVAAPAPTRQHSSVYIQKARKLVTFQCPLGSAGSAPRPFKLGQPQMSDMSTVRKCPPPPRQ